MFSSFFVSIALTCISVCADVTPNFPAGDLQTTGKTCHIAWAGDKNSTTAWKDMSIEFMTGDNLNMVHLTTVATGRDGTVDGAFDWTCPDVTPNAAIYFYQFRSPHTSMYEWTTRFPIASSSGKVTSPPNSTQPDGKPIPWGTGALVNPVTVVPPISFTTSITTTTSPATSATPEKPPVPSATPSSGCTSLFSQTSPFCNSIAGMFNVTVENSEPRNGSAIGSICNLATPGLAHCLAGPAPVTATSTTTSPSPVLPPVDVASGVVPGCTKFFNRTTEFCTQIIAKYGITVAQFESWNGGAHACDVLESGKAYCIAGP